MDDAEIVIGPVDLAARVDEALAVQAVAFGLDADEVAVRRHIVLRHLLSPGARAYGATTPGGRLVGFVYGMPNDRTTGGPPSSRRTCAPPAPPTGSTTPSPSPSSTSTPTSRAGARAAR